MLACCKKLGFIGGLAALAILMSSLAPGPAAARVFVGIGFGFPAFYYPPPYYPYYAYPPPAWYPPPPAEYYPPPADYYAPPARPETWTAPAPPRSNISYTNKPGWTDAAGRPCREYRATQRINGRATAVYGTACRFPDGRWRVVD